MENTSRPGVIAASLPPDRRSKISSASPQLNRANSPAYRWEAVHTRERACTAVGPVLYSALDNVRQPLFEPPGSRNLPTLAAFAVRRNLHILLLSRRNKTARETRRTETDDSFYGLYICRLDVTKLCMYTDIQLPQPAITTVTRDETKGNKRQPPTAQPRARQQYLRAGATSRPRARPARHRCRRLPA